MPTCNFCRKKSRAWLNLSSPELPTWPWGVDLPKDRCGDREARPLAHVRQQNHESVCVVTVWPPHDRRAGRHDGLDAPHDRNDRLEKRQLFVRSRASGQGPAPRLRVVDVPVTTDSRQEGQSNVSVVADGIAILFDTHSPSALGLG